MLKTEQRFIHESNNQMGAQRLEQVIVIHSSRRKFLIPAIILLVVLHFFFSPKASAESSIVDVRRNIQLADSDPVYKDFYLSNAQEAGLKVSQVVRVVRRVPMRDATGVQSFGEMNIEVGRLKIIFVQDNMAVGREYELFSRDNLPMLDQIGIMIGDRIDTKGSFLDNKTKSAKRSKPEGELRLAEAQKPAE